MDRAWKTVYLVCKIIDDVINNPEYIQEYKIDFVKKAIKDLMELSENKSEENTNFKQ